MKPLLRSAIEHPVGRFLVGGASTTLVSYAAYLVLLRWCPYLVAYGIAFALGIGWSYGVNTLFVFRARPSLLSALAFPLVYLAQWLVGSVVLAVFVDGLHLPPQWGPAVVVVVTWPLTYVLSRWIIAPPSRHDHSNARRSRAKDDFMQHTEPSVPVNRFARVIDPIVAAAMALAVAVYVSLPAPATLRVPLSTGGDATSAQYIFKSILRHGTYLRNPDVGAPFGATMYDYPIPEPTHHIFIRLLGLVSSDVFVVFNLFYLLSFASVAATACWALRRLGIGRAGAIAGAIAFALLPYHFMRLGHIFLASYAAVPVFCFFALQLATWRAPPAPDSARLKWGAILGLAIAAGMGVYYAFFGMLFIVFAALTGFARTGSKIPLRFGAVYAAAIVAVIAASLLPSMLYHLSEGANQLVGTRLPVESDIYGLRISQLLFPTSGHRIPLLSTFAAAYQKAAPAMNENVTASLGFVGGIGFIIALGALFFANTRKYANLWSAGALCVAGVLYATIGGFGVIFSYLVTPEMRGLNRISVFIGFFAFYAFFAAAQILAARMPHRRLVGSILAVAVVGLACFDEIPRIGRIPQIGFEANRAFFAKVQEALPTNSAVFELPYTFFPESPSPKRYDLLVPYLFTEGFRWSFGEMHGRPGDSWNKQVASLHGSDFVNALATSGFSAVYVDRTSYADNGAAVEKELRTLFGDPIIEDAKLGRAFYRVPAADKDAAPHIAVELGRGWTGWKTQQAKESSTASGNADLVVANPSRAAVGLLVRFELTSSASSKIALRYDDETVAARTLSAGETASFDAPISAKAGVSRLAIRLDASSADGATRTPPSIRIENLGWAAERSL